MRFGLQLGYWSAAPPEGVGALVDAAEANGFDAVFTAESWGSDAFGPLAWWGARTSRLQLGTAIAQLSARTPAATAMHALTLDHLSGGRFVLGLGVSGPQVVEGWYGQSFARPLARTREYLSIIRKVLAREGPVTSEGPHYPLPLPDSRLGKPLKPITHPLRAELPIWLGAEGPRNVTLAGEIADGWMPVYYSPRMAGMYNDWLADGFRASGRNRTGFTIAANAPVSITDKPEQVYAGLKPIFALYIGGMGAKERNFHAELFTRMGYGTAVEEIGKRFLSGEREAAVEAVPDELIAEVSIVGSRAQVLAELDRWADAGVDMVLAGARSVAEVELLGTLAST
ncbi:LLM class F420-dependent oxidoreductase [Sciscionella marina]|uniref:LLM class F420-dependent oxidoreductase n=1 Tax=Sciscionella marina TaxID=508770 RepID=UPI0003602FD5|nr:LLM class F420-dependent oxidoreductase [Sciscionella marina]